MHRARLRERDASPGIVLMSLALAPKGRRLYFFASPLNSFVNSFGLKYS